MAERLHDLKQTNSFFHLIGLATGVKGRKFYRNGETKSGGKWNAMEFGVRINEDKIVWVTLNGFTRNEVFYYKPGQKGEKGDTKKVAWKDRLKSPGAGYNLIGLDMSIDKDENGSNINKFFTEYDAIEWLHEHLADNEPIDVMGKLEFSSYVDRNGENRKKIELVPNKIYYSRDTIDFKKDDFTECAEFYDTFIFGDIEREMDENGKPSGRFIVSGYSVGYNSVENISFIIDEDNAAFANKIRKKMKPGHSIKMFGRISIQHSISDVIDEDEDWCTKETSRLKRVNAPSRTEYIIYDVDGKTYDTETYSEDAIAEAIRKVNAAKEAAKNFGEKPSVVPNSDTNGWEDDDDNDLDSPW